jgi:hypothetical protein
MLNALSTERRDDRSSSVVSDELQEQQPGSERQDEEERLFMESLPQVGREFLESHKGLGNSQKAEVAWLEKEGLEYEEIDVRDFMRQEQAEIRKLSRRGAVGEARQTGLVVAGRGDPECADLGELVGGATLI